MVGDVVAFHAAYGDEYVGSNIDLFQELLVLGLDLVKDVLVIIDKIHLVHQHGHLLYAQHGQKIAVAAGVFLNASGSVDDQQRRFGAGSAGDHVFEKFDVAGGVDYYIAPLVRLEKAAGGIDGYALRLLVFQSVQQKGIFKRLGVALAHFADCVELALGQGIGVRHKPADNGGFAVINVADCYDIHDLFHI